MHVLKTVAIKDDVFDCGRPEHAALFEKSDKAVIEFIRREGVLEPMLIAEGLEDGMLPTITTPPVPARIPDPSNPPQFIPDLDPNNPGGPQIVDPANPGGMMEDRAETIIWEGQLKSLAKRREKLAEGLMTAFATYWDQCSLTVRGKL